MTTFQTFAILTWVAGAIFVVAVANDTFQWLTQAERDEYEIDPRMVVLTAVFWPIAMTDLALMLIIGAVAVANARPPLPDPELFAEAIHVRFGPMATIAAWSFWIGAIWMVCS